MISGWDGVARRVKLEPSKQTLVFSDNRTICGALLKEIRSTFLVLGCVQESRSLGTDPLVQQVYHHCILVDSNLQCFGVDK